MNQQKQKKEFEKKTGKMEKTKQKNEETSLFPPKNWEDRTTQKKKHIQI